jgi:hypothetical protein
MAVGGIPQDGLPDRGWPDQGIPDSPASVGGGSAARDYKSTLAIFISMIFGGNKWR